MIRLIVTTPLPSRSVVLWRALRNSPSEMLIKTKHRFGTSTRNNHFSRITLGRRLIWFFGPFRNTPNFVIFPFSSNSLNFSASQSYLSSPDYYSVDGTRRTAGSARNW